ncbi:MAG: PGPGW domain-containing protein, partial [Desulfobacterales bacterium]|nr:PGPGW domain-containing protein [Desulfobacterales bacterium]
LPGQKVTFFGFENYRFIRNIIGFTLLIIGIPLIPLPGPGIVVTTVALDLLSQEFLWAKQFMHKFKQFFKKEEKKT